MDEREIKVRAWDIQKKEMLYKAEQEQYHDTTIFHPNARDKYTLMQWTGLTDENGKGIYEGDILSQMIETPDGFRKIVGVMEWNKDLAQFGLFLETKDDDPLAGKHFEVKESVSGRPKVIGNIYENPELLK